MDDLNEEVVVDDRRAAIEAAFETAESDQPELPGIDPAPAREAPAAKPEAPAAKPETESQGVATPPAPDAPTTPEFPVDKAPQSWRPAQKAKWDALDPDVRQEVVRREREMTRTLGETAQARQVASHFQQTVQPYMARIQSLGAQPLQAVGELLKSDHILSTAPPQQRAQFMAKMITDYGVDIQALDSALAGKAQPESMDTRVEQLLQQRLAPFQTYLQQQQQREQAAAQRERDTLNTSIEQMQSDTAKYPHFDTVREDMADLIEIQAKRGVYLPLDQAYTRAIAMNPEVSQVVNAASTAEAKRLSALAANAKAQKALSASKSVGGSPGGTPSGAPSASDRRAIIEAAFDSVGGR